MRTVVVYPFPLERRDTFEPFARRYVETYLKYPPGCEHAMIISAMNPKEQILSLRLPRKPWEVLSLDMRTKNMADLERSRVEASKELTIFNPLPEPKVIFINSEGLDIGCAQSASPLLVEYDFAVFSTSRVYFHRPGWLKRLVDAREKYGDGLYGATGSYECPNGEPDKFPNPHMRTVLYGCNPKHMAELANIYPVTDRASAHSFEAGDHNFSRWFKEKGMPVKMVTWAGEWDEPYWRAPHGCFFRQSNQSNILCFDRHSDAYRDASPEEKRRLERITG